VQTFHTLPGDILNRLAEAGEATRALVVLTGESGMGKTTCCLELARLARLAGIQPFGLVSPAVFERGVKTGIDLLDLSTGQHRRLAVKRNPAASRTHEPPALARLHWLVDPAVLVWGNQLLGKLPPGELLILDELGPLEFLDETGLTAGLALVDNRNFRLSCVVVRPSLIEIALERWPWVKTLWMPDQPAEAKPG
jgi:nucleoside-triphosphatase THEP1